MATMRPPAGWSNFSTPNCGGSPPRACGPSALDHTLQPTAVVHQLYLELVKVKALRPASSGGADEKAAFLGLAAFLMKRLLIHHARPLSKRAEKAELARPARPAFAHGTFAARNR